MTGLVQALTYAVIRVVLYSALFLLGYVFGTWSDQRMVVRWLKRDHPEIDFEYRDDPPATS